jgi:superoxide dismutase, Cu-Zn family
MNCKLRQVGLCVFASLMLLCPSLASAQQNVIRAIAIVHGAPGSGIEGTVTFIQSPADHNLPIPTVEVIARIWGSPETLTPGLHGFHIHENGICEPPAFTKSGGHFDPGPFGNSTPVDANHPYHAGDLPNLEVNAAGVGHLRTTTNRITLSPGPLSVFDADNPATPFNDAGSSVIVHLNEDQGITGAPGSGVSGGPRIACGIIQMDH